MLVGLADLSRPRPDERRIAWVAGATGRLGDALVEQILASGRYSRVSVLACRSMATTVSGFEAVDLATLQARLDTRDVAPALYDSLTGPAHCDDCFLLLDPDAERELRALLERATLITPNLAELAVLSARDIVDWADALAAAEHLSAEVGTAILVKGGHLTGDEAPDALVDARRGLRQEFTAPRIATANTHGTGCSLSSALATLLARGAEAGDAVRDARAWLRESLRAGEALRVGRGNGPISHFAGVWELAGTAAPADAGDIAAEWWRDVADLRAGIDELPFIRALADGTLDREPFLSYLAQDALYLREYARVLAEASRLAPTSAEQAFWAESAHGSIVGELELHASWLTPSQGVSAATFQAEPGQATTAYLDHLRSVAFGGDYAEIIAAVLPCFWLYTDLGRRLHAGEFGEYARDAQHPYASWLATYADPAFEEATRIAIAYASEAAAAADAGTRLRMGRAFRISSSHELAFFAAPMTP